MKLLSRLFCLFLLLLPACNSSVPKIERLPSGSTVLAFGDSLTVGKGAKESLSYPKVLEQLTGLKVIRSGVSGEVTARGLKRLPKILEEYQPKLLILCHGGNDILRRYKASDTKENLRKMIKIALSKGISVVLLGVPSMSLGSAMGLGGDPAPYYQELAEEFNLPIENEILPELLFKNEYKSDRVHLNGAGYRKMAEAVAELLRDTGAI